MHIIDFHAHIYPDKIADAAVRGVGDFYGLGMDGSGRTDMLLACGKQCGISSFVVHSVATQPRQVSSINRFIAEQQSLHPEFIGFGTIHPGLSDPAAAVSEIEELGLCGVKIHPDSQDFVVDSPEMFNIYDMIRGRLPILIHCGDYRYDNSHPRRILRILRNFPDLTLIAAHFGGWSIPDIAFDFLKNESCFVDCSSSFAMVGRRHFLELINMYGSERVIFGSDYPMWDPARELSAVMSLGLSSSAQEDILQNNAQRALGPGGRSRIAFTGAQL